ncbi:MAG: hypothetical protein JWR30_2351 [Conexibacter sp.]|nr:hypothetical protein [Conexibacter sp.]MCZ4494501.1 hypothetical protein [Conexibacter sp.]MDX6716622.1 hypothetical protein [Baekduia sp.]MDX6733564.1 hypothetical protein [Baekduia sp.]
MYGDRIEPIGPKAPSASRIPAIRRSEDSTEKRRRDEDQAPRKRPPVPPAEPPPDDGLPHIDVRV